MEGNRQQEKETVAALTFGRAGSRSEGQMQASLSSRVVAAFDFDGTLTTSDTLMAFIRFTHGRSRLLFGFLLHAHWLLMMKLGLYPNGKAKEKVFSHFYKGTTHKQFVQWGREFAVIAETLLNSHTVDILKQHLAEGHTVLVVTASIDEWVRPICERLGASTILATQVEVSPSGKLTGRFLTPNCYGKQKVTRLQEAFLRLSLDHGSLATTGAQESYKLYAYGDSRGDNELLAMADVGFRIGHNKKNENSPLGGITVVRGVPSAY